jgi:hypothetical protein
VKLTATTITEDQIRALMATADRETRKICEVALRSDDAKTRGALLMKARRKGAARARCAEVLNDRAQPSVTADSITDEQIRALSAQLGTDIAADCDTALAAPLGSLRRVQARARLAEILNTRSVP